MDAFFIIAGAFFFIGIIFFFIHQAIEQGRTPIRVFFSPITNKECKILCDVIQNAVIEWDGLNERHIINNKDYVLQKSYTNGYTLNGVKLSLGQEKRILKAVQRNRLKAGLLSPAGQVLYGNKNEK